MAALTFDEFAPAQGAAPAAAAPAGKGGMPVGAGGMNFDEFLPQGTAPELRSYEELKGVDMLSHGKDIGQPKEVPGATVAPSPLSSGTADDLKTGAQAGAGSLGDIREKIKSYLPESARKTADTLFRHLAANPATSVLFGGPLAAVMGAPTTPELANATGHEQTTPSGLVGAAVQGAATMGTNPLSYLGGGGVVPKVAAALAGGAGSGVGNQIGGPIGGAVGGALGGAGGAGVGGGVEALGNKALASMTAAAKAKPIPGIPQVNMADMPTYQATTSNVKGAYGATPINANPAFKPPPTPTTVSPPNPNTAGNLISEIVSPHNSIPTALGAYAGHAMGAPFGLGSVGGVLGGIAGRAAAPAITRGAQAVGRHIPNLNLGAALRGGLLGSQIGTP